MKLLLNKYELYTFCIFIIFISSSFDVFLNIKIGGFSIRFCYLVLFFLIMLILLKEKNFFLRFIGLNNFLIWTFILLVFLQNTTILSRNIGYMLWHIINFVFIIVITNCVKNEMDFLKIFKYYIKSFGIMGLIGIFQFILGIVGFDFYVTQWWVGNKFPRVNGFCYEPSFYATYMLIGWAILFFLIREKAYVLNKRMMIVNFTIITISIILSSSRMGLAFIILLTLFYFVGLFLKELIRMRIKIRSMYIFLGVILSGIFLVILFSIILDKYKFLLMGTGIAGTSAHSNEDRMGSMILLLKIWVEEPFIGVSLGGIPSAIGAHLGKTVTTVESAKKFEGINVFLEMLVASGSIGFIFFMFYIISLFYFPLKLSNHILKNNRNNALIIKSIVYSLFCVFIMLCFNQNILRFYLWILIGILNAAYYNFKISKVNIAG